MVRNFILGNASREQYNPFFDRKTFTSPDDNLQYTYALSYVPIHMLFLYYFASKASVVSSVKVILCNYDVWFMTVYRRIYCPKICLHSIERSITTNSCRCIQIWHNVMSKSHAYIIT